MSQLRDPNGGVRWDFCSNALPDAINPTDIDLAFEHWDEFLILEGKRDGEEIPRGQARFLEAMNRQPRFTVVKFEGQPPDDIHRYALWGGEWIEATTDSLVGEIKRWHAFTEQV